MDCIPSYVRNEKSEAAYHSLKSSDSFVKNCPNNHSFNIYQTKGTQLSNEKSIYMYFLKTKGIIIIIRIFEMIATYV